MINEEKISVVYLGSSFTVLEINKRKEDYILFTGQRSGYKNFESFIKAIAPLLLEYDLRLVCSGQNFNKREEELLNSLNIKNRVTYKYFSDDELKDSYSKAIAFVFPSLYEGFGIPVLEAFSSGCPAVLSKMSALSEIGGEAAEYFDPYSIEDMRKTIEKVITSPSLREQLSYKGKERIKNYSWEKCVIDTDLVYKSL
jgi:glycosyltransferase involved in cell wall biosynthesis